MERLCYVVSEEVLNSSTWATPRHAYACILVARSRTVVADGAFLTRRVTASQTPGRTGVAMALLENLIRSHTSSVHALRRPPCEREMQQFMQASKSHKYQSTIGQGQRLYVGYWETGSGTFILYAIPR